MLLDCVQASCDGMHCIMQASVPVMCMHMQAWTRSREEPRAHQASCIASICMHCARRPGCVPEGSLAQPR